MEASLIMAQTAAAVSDATPVALPVIPVRELLPWALFAFVIGALMIYFVGAEEGATSVFGGTYVHEFVHDGRHLLGFPCH
jgi:cobalt transporter subunit CbtB